MLNVLISDSGHGGQVEDKDGDEMDGFDEGSPQHNDRGKVHHRFFNLQSSFPWISGRTVISRMMYV